jgi:carboxypeptidase Q
MTLLLIAALAAPRKAPPPPDASATAGALLGAALLDGEAYDEIAYLADVIGPRFSGSPGLDQAIAWTAQRMRDDGLAVHTEAVDVPVWVRGPASLDVVAPERRSLSLLALGGSVSTPASGLEADVLVVSTFEELEARRSEAVGHIVVWDAPFTGYGTTVKPTAGPAAIVAAGAGAVASLTRSGHPCEPAHAPHRRCQALRRRRPQGPRRRDHRRGRPAPAAAPPQPRRHRPEAHASSSAPTRAPDAPSAQCRRRACVGREKPKEIVVIGCHLDTWDVGQRRPGRRRRLRQRHGRGPSASPRSPSSPARTLSRSSCSPTRRTACGAARATPPPTPASASSTPSRTTPAPAPPLGFGVDRPDGAEPAAAALQPWAPWLAPVGADVIRVGHSGADIGPLVKQGAVGLGLEHDMTGYWPIHHTEADTLDKIDPAMVRRNVAAMAVMAWILTEVAPTP